MQRSRGSSPRRTQAPCALVLLLVSAAGCSERAYEHPDDMEAKLTLAAERGTFEELGDGLYLLTLGGVSASTGYSADGPVAASGEVSTGDVLANFQWDETNPPSAAVVIGDPTVSEDQDSMLVRLMLPTYDQSAGTLTLYVQADTTYAGEMLAAYTAGADASLPASFGQSTLTVESWWHHPSCSKGYISCYKHYGCCSQPSVTQPLGRFKVDRCWEWSRFSCQPCSEDPCASEYPSQCGKGNCYTSCNDDCDGPPY